MCFFTKSSESDLFVTFEFATSKDIGISQFMARDELFKEMNNEVGKLSNITDDIFLNTQKILQRQSVHVNSKIYCNYL